jgi:hypothetical protein
MSFFESITSSFESVKDNVNGQSGFAGEASLLDPSANQIIGRMSQTGGMDQFPSADSLLSGFTGGNMGSMQQQGDKFFSAQVSQVVEAPANIGNMLDSGNTSSMMDSGNSSNGGGIFGGLNDLTQNLTKLTGELQNLFQCTQVPGMLSNAGLDSIMGGSGGGSQGGAGALGGLGGLVGEVAKDAPAIASVASLFA